MNKEVDYWFTTENGTHVPVGINETKKEAMNHLFNDKTYRDIREKEKSRRDLDHEELSIYSKEGNLIKDMKGESAQVDAREYKEIMNNSIITHNHPLGDNFSKNDIKSFIDYNVHELRASTNNGTFIIKKKNDEKIKEDLYNDFSEMDRSVMTEASKIMNEKIKNNELSYVPAKNPKQYWIDRQKISSEIKDKWLRENATKYGIIYVKEEE